MGARSYPGSMRTALVALGGLVFAAGLALAVFFASEAALGTDTSPLAPQEPPTVTVGTAQTTGTTVERSTTTAETATTETGTTGTVDDHGGDDDGSGRGRGRGRNRGSGGGGGGDNSGSGSDDD
jgi:hypothetical protein